MIVPEVAGQAGRIAAEPTYALEHRYTKDSGRLFLTGIQALVRLLLTQRRLDRAAGLDTAGFVTGYRGSPLAGLDQAVAEAGDLLSAADIVVRPGLNEALAATACLGTQQVAAEPRRTVEGVFALWYGKGPGVDWAGDAIKHGNAYGTSPKGGVLVVAGDDHGAVSSTMAHQSDQTLAAWYLPVLNPTGIADYLDLGLYGWALSRFSGAWVGLKAISETVESAASIVVPKRLPRFVSPAGFVPPPGGLHHRWIDPPSVAIEERLEAKLAAARAFAGANKIDRLVIDHKDAWLGIVTVGKAHGDLMEALRALGLDDSASIAAAGIRILNVRQSFPLEPEAPKAFARGLEALLVVEEKRPLVEGQLKELLFHLPADRRPRVLGKTTAEGARLLPATGELRPHRLAPVLAGLLRSRVPGVVLREPAPLPGSAREPGEPKRTPWFCSGCPHNTSTVVPDGSFAMGGIGCHIMATWMPDRPTLGTTQMGGEGANWIGLAPFTKTPHVFQNLGDGTFFHSGQLAIRQAAAAGARITFKILFNDAVAMTGGQAHDGPLDVPQITRLVAAERVGRIAVVSDEPDKYPADAGFAPGVTFHHRRGLDAVQKELAAFEGVSVLVYDQTCAAEKRRRRKLGTFPDPDRRIVINEAVCEGCGDCSRTSNCLSVAPLETDLGTKRQIDQSSCNKDFSCVEGFCPSFVSVSGAKLKKGKGVRIDDAPVAAALAGLPAPTAPDLAQPWNILVTGVGGTGVLTVGALIGMAAHLEGKAASVLDFTGLAQKGGAVLSHVRLAAAAIPLHAARIEPGEADALLACDLVVGAAAEARSILRHGRTRVVANADTMPTSDFVRNPSFRLDIERLIKRLRDAAGRERVDAVDTAKLARAVTGDSIAANVLLLGVAWQKGLVPVGLDALHRAIELNGVAVAANKAAFAWGRLLAHDPLAVARLAGLDARHGAPAEPSLADLLARRRALIVDYQDEAWAQRWQRTVELVQAAEARAVPGAEPRLSRAIAEGLFRAMTYKDEYEVARLHADGRLKAKLAGMFEDGARLTFHMAPPLLARRDPSTARPRKMALGGWLLPVMGLLRHGKRLRGTALDPFGRTEERRAERALIAEIEALAAELARDLAPHNHATAVKVAASIERVRGFGHVKAGNLEAWRAELPALLAAFHAPAPEPTGTTPAWALAAE